MNYFPFPISVNWNLTNLCNLSCRHCYSQKTRSCLHELTFKEACRIIDNLKAAHVWIVTLGGGECLLRDDIFDICKRLVEEGIKPRIISNGLVIDIGIVEQLHKSGVKEMLLSLDGPTADVHDTFRNHNGLFDSVLRSIELLNKANIQVSLLTNINRINHKHLNEFCELVRTLNIAVWRINDLKPIGLNAAFYNMMILSRKEMQYAYETIYSYSKDLSCQLQFDSVYCGIKSGLLPKMEIPGCHCGRMTLGIRSDGDIVPCVYHDKVLGNALHDDLLSIWNHNEYLETIRKREPTGKCLSCDFKNRCKGGCFVRAIAINGSIDCCDPLCWI